MTTLTMQQQSFAPQVKRHTVQLTENGFTVAEEMRIFKKLQAVRNGTAKIISAEEMRRKIELEN